MRPWIVAVVGTTLLALVALDACTTELELVGKTNDAGPADGGPTDASPSETSPADAEASVGLGLLELDQSDTWMSLFVHANLHGNETQPLASLVRDVGSGCMLVTGPCPDAAPCETPGKYESLGQVTASVFGRAYELEPDNGIYYFNGQRPAFVEGQRLRILASGSRAVDWFEHEIPMADPEQTPVATVTSADRNGMLRRGEDLVISFNEPTVDYQVVRLFGGDNALNLLSCESTTSLSEVVIPGTILDQMERGTFDLEIKMSLLPTTHFHHAGYDFAVRSMGSARYGGRRTVQLSPL